MKTTTTLVALFAAVTAALAVCFGPLAIPCPELTGQYCPDGGLNTSTATCESSKKKELNVLASVGAWGLTASAGNCPYLCWYMLDGHQIGCGTTNVPWIGSKPDGTTSCPGTGTGTGSNPPE